MSRRLPLLVATAAFTVVTLAAPAALADSPNVPGARAGQTAYSKDITTIAATQPSAVVRNVTLAAAAVGSAPKVTRVSGQLTRNPDTNNSDAFTTPATTCTLPACEELRVTVPKGSSQTLYARAAWASTTQYVHVWGISPSNHVIGQSKVNTSIDKRVGNADVAPLAEFTVHDPEPGMWRIQVRAVFGVKIPVDTSVALVKGPALEAPQLNVTELADHYLTQDLTYNIVMVNRKWAADELAAFKAAMPTEYRSAVLVKQYDDGCTNSKDPQADQAVSSSAGTLANWGTSYYCGTDGTGGSGNKPYFEPLKYRIHYRFLEANSTWTRDLFSVMQAHTTKDQPFTLTGATGNRRQTQGQYLAQYDSQDGKAMRGGAHLVTNPNVGDKIDAFAVEDWIFAHRGDRKYSAAFKDIVTKTYTSGRFINPDPGAYFDPFYNGKGKKNLDVVPQGASTSMTFFALDTFGSGADGDFTSRYFRPTAYHFFDVSKRMVDPDLKDASGPDYARAWGGRYRFFMHDLGAGPNTYESADTALTQNYGGSASAPYGDPPIWDYQNNPTWAGEFAARTARDAKIWLLTRFLGAYLYRPVPADVYLLADSNWQDCYSNPQCSQGGVSYTNLDRIYSEAYVKKNLGAGAAGCDVQQRRRDEGLRAGPAPWLRREPCTRQSGHLYPGRRGHLEVLSDPRPGPGVRGQGERPAPAVARERQGAR